MRVLVAGECGVIREGHDFSRAAKAGRSCGFQPLKAAILHIEKTVVTTTDHRNTN